MYKTLKVDINDNIAIITFARSTAMNAYNHDMGVDLLRAFEMVDNDNDVRAILLRAEGKAFSVGGDIKVFAEKMNDMPADIPDMMEILNETISIMINSSKPILASVHGTVAGVGMSFMMACDLAITTDTTQFTLAYAGIGLTPDGGASYMLPRIVGQRRAMQMMLLPEVFLGKEAYDIGLVNWVVSSDEIDKATTRLMYKLANGPSIVYKRVKHLLNSSWANNLDDQLAEEMHAFTECTTSKDFQRGVEAFIHKTSPLFEGN